MKERPRRAIKIEWSRCLDLDDDEDRAKALSQCPYGQPGDRLWVREAWRAWREYDDLPPRYIRGQKLVHFESDGAAPECFGRKRGARFLPKHANPWVWVIEFDVATDKVREQI